MIGRITRKLSVASACRAVDGRGAVKAVVVVALDLRRLNHLLANARLPEGATLLVIDQNAVILARHPQGDELIGTRGAGAPLATAILAKRAGGAFDTVGLDGVRRLDGLTPPSPPPQ